MVLEVGQEKLNEERNLSKRDILAADLCPVVFVLGSKINDLSMNEEEMNTRQRFHLHGPSEIIPFALKVVRLE